MTLTLPLLSTHVSILSLCLQSVTERFITGVKYTLNRFFLNMVSRVFIPPAFMPRGI